MVPNGWRDLYLNEFAKIIVSPVDKKSFESETPVELCNYTDVYYNDRITQSISFMKATAKKSEIEKYTLELDDVIITKDSETPGDIAVPALVAEDLNGVVCGYHLAIVRTNKKHAIGSFINYLFSMPKTRYYFFTLATGATRFGLSIRGINKAHFQLPPLPEQRKIAKILSTWDKAISTTERLIDNSKQQKKALMQQLLTGKKRLLDVSGKPFEGEWEELTIGSTSKCFSGGTPSRKKDEYYGGQIPWITSGKVNDRFIVDANEYITELGLENSSAKLVKNGGILIAMYGATAGKVAINKLEGATINQAVLALETKANCHNLFMFYLLEVQMQKALNLVQGGQPNLSAAIIKTIKIRLPSLNEQKKIASVLANADKEIELLKEQLADLKQEKKALMQQLLTGKRRVKVDEEAVTW